MSVRSAAGTTIEISAGVPETFDVDGYEALEFTEIGEVTNPGEFGREYALITHTPVKSRGTRKFKGSFNEGQLSMQLALDEEDAGQQLCMTALDDDADYAFCVTSQAGNKYYFSAQVMSFTRQFGEADSINSATIQLEITTSADGVGVVADIVEGAAPPAPAPAP